MTPDEAATQVLKGRHGFVSYFYPQQIGLVAAVCDSFGLDNGAFSAWRAGAPVKDWTPYVDWLQEWGAHPGCDFYLIPDVIDGSEQENDDLVDWWQGRNVPRLAVPVWHLHESLGRLERLAEEWPRVALGSSGAFRTPGRPHWWARMGEAMQVVCDHDRRPRVRLHGLRMLNNTIASHIPLSSADSTFVARKMGLDVKWRKKDDPRSPVVRGLLTAMNIEAHAKAVRWSGVHGHQLNAEIFG